RELLRRTQGGKLSLEPPLGDPAACDLEDTGGVVDDQRAERGAAEAALEEDPERARAAAVDARDPRARGALGRALDDRARRRARRARAGPPRRARRRTSGACRPRRPRADRGAARGRERARSSEAPPEERVVRMVAEVDPSRVLEHVHVALEPVCEAPVERRPGATGARTGPVVLGDELIGA